MKVLNVTHTHSSYLCFSLPAFEVFLKDPLISLQGAIFF